MNTDGKSNIEKREPGEASAPSEIKDFVARMRGAPQLRTSGGGRLIFAMDATLSREPTWAMALDLQAGMFREVEAIGGLDVQLLYFRGLNECRSSGWVRDAGALARLMSSVACQGGYTQIGKVLVHARRETEKAKVSAVVFVGDAMEEPVDALCALAGELGLLRTPVFLFQEGADPRAETAFREIARLSGGAHLKFDAGSARQLGELLRAVAAYAVGGRTALEAPGASRGARLLLEQMKR